MVYNELPLDETDQLAPQWRGLIPMPRLLQTSAGHIVVAIASAAVLLPIAATNGQSNPIELVQPISPGVEALAIALGTLIGVVLAEAWTVAWRQGHLMFLTRLSLGIGLPRTGHNVRSDARASRSLRGWLLMLVLVIGAVLAATRLAREVVMWRAFVGVTAGAMPEPVTIVGKAQEGGVLARIWRYASRPVVERSTSGECRWLCVSPAGCDSVAAGRDRSRRHTADGCPLSFRVVTPAKLPVRNCPNFRRSCRMMFE